METFENTVMIRQPAEEVFAFLADFENVPRWNYAIEKTRKASPGPVGVGTTYRQTRSIPGRSEEGFEVTVFEPGQRLAVRGQIGPFCPGRLAARCCRATSAGRRIGPRPDSRPGRTPP
jgi:hypothetical protein